MLFTVGFKILSALSIIVSVTLMGGSGLTFGSGFVDLEEEFNSLGVDDVKEELKIMWQRTQPVLLTSSVIAFIGGIAQCIVSTVAMINSYKTLKFRVKYWLIIHLVLFFTLVICLMVTLVANLKVDEDNQTWSKKVEKFQKSLKNTNIRSMDAYYNDLDQLCEYLRIKSIIFYCVVSIDIVVTVILFLSLLILMRNRNYQYEEA